MRALVILVVVAGCGGAAADLVMVGKHHRTKPMRLRAEAAGALARLLDDARAAGHALWVGSAFRTHAEQAALHAASEPGWVARPGESEHQLGTAVDLVTSASSMLADGSATYAWMDAHAWRHGWINSYPPASGDRTKRYTGIEVEPWHWRHVGAAAAARHRDVFVATGIRMSSTELRDLLRGTHDPAFDDHDALAAALSSPR